MTRCLFFKMRVEMKNKEIPRPVSALPAEC
jgi:hypothetical protein